MSEIKEQAPQAGPAGAGPPAGAEELLSRVYGELRVLAARKMASERPGQTLQATALVHEAWLRLGGESQPAWVNQAQFFAAAAEAMRRILIDRARQRSSAKRGGDGERVDLEAVELATEAPDGPLLALDEALERLAVHDSVKAELVKLRFFTGLTIEQAAEALGISSATAKRHWAYARAWLFREVNRG